MGYKLIALWFSLLLVDAKLLMPCLGLMAGLSMADTIPHVQTPFYSLASPAVCFDTDPADRPELAMMSCILAICLVCYYFQFSQRLALRIST